MAANFQSCQNHFNFLRSSANLPRFPLFRNPNLIVHPENNSPICLKLRVLCPSNSSRHGFCSICCFSKPSSQIERVSTQEEVERPPFDINLAVILAGFAFEAYTSPPEKLGKREVDAAGCQTVILSGSFLREIYDGQLFVKLKKGYDFPAMDPWGTSDPYVVMQLDSQIVKSKVKWATREPTWNEEIMLYIKHPPTKDLQVAAWDANLVTPHKRMGNASINLEPICDGNSHEVLVDLEGMGGGGKVQLEVKYKSFDRIEEEKNWWRIPIVAEFLRNNGFESALRKVVGSQPVQARQFVEYAFGQLKSFNDTYFHGDGSTDNDKSDVEESKISSDHIVESDLSQADRSQDGSLEIESNEEDVNLSDMDSGNTSSDGGETSSIMTQVGTGSQSDKHFWKNFADTINRNVVKQLGLPAPQKIKWDGFDLLSKIGLQSQSIAEAGYIKSGLATPSGQDSINDQSVSDTSTISSIQSSFPDIKRVTQDLLRQTESILGALMVLNATVTELTKDGGLLGKSDTKEDVAKMEDRYLKGEMSGSTFSGPVLDERKAEEMRALFSTAESAMEAWAMLATSLGHPSFIKSEFEKICFLDNPITDTQVAIWRDSTRKRLVVAFRGTEQAKWKDLLTDLMLVPAGLNPERIGGDFKQEVQVHSGFLSAYDSVRTRIMTLIKTAIGYLDDDADDISKWHVYVTGHSLGGALATLLALELSSSRIAKHGAISVTMYNFGSPRVGNRNFAEVYNEKVKDSWRVVNHRDIIPTVPRLMGYCHVAQPVYLAAGVLENALENIEPLEDGYQGDVIGEYTPDVLVNEFMKGEKELVEKILNTEINIFRSIRDGTALMQHMEDFYYITLLENVRSNYRTVANSENGDEVRSSIKEA